MHYILDWLYHVLGVAGSGPFYGFWSGFGSDLTELGILGGLISMYRKNNCEVHKCWRIGKHKTEAGHYVCRRHHPDSKLTAETVLELHKAAIHLRKHKND